MNDAERYLQEVAGRVEAFAAAHFARLELDTPAARAARYALDAGGKRLRPGLVLAAAEACGARGEDEDLVAVAAAFEYIHTYSLMHDDLPVMDNDAMRRGKPSCHVAHGVEHAVRGGLLLIALAYEAIAGTRLGEKRRIVEELTAAAGTRGMVGGQALDILGENRPADAEELVRIHMGKTAALIRGAIVAGALAAGAPADRLTRAREAGQAAGLAFQIVDDLLDVESTAERMGKPVGVDSGKGKRTYPSVLGVEASRRRAGELVAAAEAALREMGADDTMLFALVQFILRRTS